MPTRTSGLPSCQVRVVVPLSRTSKSVSYSKSLAFSPLSELYSYTEAPEFALNRQCFEVEFREHGVYQDLDKID